MTGLAALLRCLFVLALAGVSAAGEQPAGPNDDASLEQVTVTAQRFQESAIDVPIALSVFSGDELSRRQIGQATDLQLHVPNVTFSRGNFNGANFQIRGIGASAVGAGAESGVEAHFNSMPIRMARLVEAEYFDVERVEVLRGPQGTLYGRNATGGVINVLAIKPQKDESSGNLEVEAADGNGFAARGAVNLPLGDVFSMRFAATGYRRDGYARNLYTDNDIDGREQWAVRGALRAQPSDATDITLMVNYYDEDSTRLRATSRMCHRDPSGALGCLPDRLGFDATNHRATLNGTLGELLPLVVPGAAPVALIAPGTDMNAGAFVSSDPRRMYGHFDPVYRGNETIATLEIVHDFGDWSVTALGGYQQTSLFSRTDENWLVTAGDYNGGGLNALFGGSIPLTNVDADTTGGSGYVGTFTSPTAYDQPRQKAHQWSQELRIASHASRPFNFQLGALYLSAEDDESYSIAATEWEYASRLLQRQPSFFAYEAPEAALRSTAVFGEVYWQQSQQLKWTLGLRWTQDEKRLEDRRMLLSVPPTAPLPDFRERRATFSEVTGRFGADWKPGWFDDATLYAFYSRGYKAGGFNPSAAGIPETYAPEFVHSFEIGSKTAMAQGRVLANLGAFYYRYQGLQMSKIVARSSVNENVDADLYGIEGEIQWSPVSTLHVDASFGVFESSIQDFSSIDPRDVSDGNPAWTVVKDVSNASNYVIPTANLAAARAAGCILPAALGGPFGLVGANPACGTAFGVIEGIAVDLDGRELPSAPDWSIDVGAQYTFELAGKRLTPRLEYYRRDSFYTRVFNRPIDKVGAWDRVDLSIELVPASSSWHVRAFCRNLLDREDIAGMYLSDASAGLFTNVFALEPRSYGVAVGFEF